MYMCMYACVYVYVCICICMYMYVCVYEYAYVCVCICVYLYVYVCICTCMYMCLYMNAYVYGCKCICIGRGRSTVIKLGERGAENLATKHFICKSWCENVDVGVRMVQVCTGTLPGARVNYITVPPRGGRKYGNIMEASKLWYCQSD